MATNTPVKLCRQNKVRKAEFLTYERPDGKSVEFQVRDDRGIRLMTRPEARAAAIKKLYPWWRR